MIIIHNPLLSNSHWLSGRRAERKSGHEARFAQPRKTAALRAAAQALASKLSYAGATSLRDAPAELTFGPHACRAHRKHPSGARGAEPPGAAARQLRPRAAAPRAAAASPPSREGPPRERPRLAS